MLKSIIFLGAFIVSSYARAGVVGDIDGDGKVGLPETIYSLQSLAGIRPPSATAQVKVISGYAVMDNSTFEMTIMTVPSGKMIVITDIIVIDGGNWYLYENTFPKVYIKEIYGREYHFNSGIPFSSGTNIIAKSAAANEKKVFISGYEVDQ
jgi:hypothetical protein